MTNKKSRKTTPKLPPMKELMTNYKVKKHEPVWYEELLTKVDEDLTKIKEFRLKVIVIHIYIEYWINELIRALFKRPKIIIDNGDLGTFENKIRILESRGIFDNHKDLLKNIRMTQRIRNHYSHKLILKDEVDEQVKAQIDNMKPLYAPKGRNLSKMTYEEKFIHLSIDAFIYLDQLNDHVWEYRSMY